MLKVLYNFSPKVISNIYRNAVNRTMPSLFGAAFFVGHIYIYKKLGRETSHPNFILLFC